MSVDVPLVSCIMPTYNRRKFVRHAITYFLRQDYEQKELIIIDDGNDCIRDLVPELPSIRYYRLEQKITLGAKLNMACNYAAGNIIANWDDDDWYADRRLSYQVSALAAAGTDVCGINKLLYYDLQNKNAYQYIYPPDQRVWLLGSSLCYSKDLWKRNHFADIDVGMDGLFVWNTAPERVTVLDDHLFSVHMIHEHNVSPKKTNGIWWHHHPVSDIQNLMGPDWEVYEKKDRTEHLKSNGFVLPGTQNPAATSRHSPVKNVYACLVHERPDCIIDLVRNLHYHDPESIILLYNGSGQPDLIPAYFQLDRFGAVLCPEPKRTVHGYLHTFALECMDFAVKNFVFDTLTIVDSDQLSLRSGYSAYMGAFLAGQSNIGLLSSRPERVGPDDKTNYVALQAFKELELWKPLLSQFTDGEHKFAHWTFWPSTVFTFDAAKDLLRLFRENGLLQEIMKHTRIWASEEVILPTLVRMLGYDIVRNPCSYEYVQYRQIYNTQDIRRAMDKEDAYWMHPVERKYEHPIRNYCRQEAGHYVDKRRSASREPGPVSGLFLVGSLLARMKRIEGWLNEEEADLLVAVTCRACSESAGPHNIVEVGSYHGKATVLLAGVVQALFPDARVFSIDPHDGKLGAADQGYQQYPPSLSMLKKNIEDAGLSGKVSIIQSKTCDVAWDSPLSLLLIDGLHDYPNVAADFYHFEAWIRPGVYVAFHDYSEYYPGVVAFVHELLDAAAYMLFQKAGSLVILQKA